MIVHHVKKPTDITNFTSNYLDGISILIHGQHVWSFAAGCNCAGTKTNKLTFINITLVMVLKLMNLMYFSGCPSNVVKIPPGSTRLASTSKDIRVRICRDQYSYDDHPAMKAVELYIQ